MARYDFRTPRLYVAEPLGVGSRLALDAAQANYLRNVLRLAGGALYYFIEATPPVLRAGNLAIALPHAFATRHRRIRSGAEGMIGRVGVVRRDDCVFVDGALWDAHPDNGEVLERGDRVVVEGVTGLTLSVRKAEEWEVPR